MTLALILVLAITVEALVEYSKLIFVEKKINWKQIAAMAVAVFLAFATGADLFALLGVTFIVPYVGVVLTGILFSRGANYVSDFMKRLQSNNVTPAGE